MLNKQIFTIIVDRPDAETDSIIKKVVEGIYINKGMGISSATVKRFQTKTELGETVSEKIVIEDTGYLDMDKIMTTVPYEDSSTKIKVVIGWKKCK